MVDNPTNVAEWEERTRRLLDLLEPLSVAGLYFLAIFSWIYGLVFGIVTLSQCKLEANKRVGKICVILAVVNFALIGCLVVGYVLLIVFALGSYAFFAPSAAGG